MKKILLSVLVILVLLTSCSGVSNNTIKIGAMLPLTGDASQYGTEFQRVAEIAAQEINDAGGINGKKLEIIYEDSKCNPKDGATAAQKLINVDDVKVILGGACSGETLGASPIAEQNKVIILSPSASSPDITNAGDFIFRTNPSDAFAGKVAAEKAASMGFKKASIIHENTDYAQGLKRVFEQVFKESGGEVVSVESYSSEESDFRTQLAKIKAANPDVVYLVPQSPIKGGLLVRQLKEAGVKSQLVMDAIMLRGILKDLGSQLEGVIGVEPKFDEKGPIAAPMLSKYKAKYGEVTFGFYDSATYDAVYLIAEALQKYGENAEKIRDYFYSIKGRPGAIGEITFDKNGDLLMKFSVEEVKNGQLVVLE
ncbi:ABC transporter substrate-binding protein [Candidatus Woesearchaeota archaeon]|nr:ABC transporter substrate-binding protein [Candidatus Woesearchaeota archaeon]